ncbi:MULTISPECIES: TetR/AcrR family transcriptional regulator [Streptomyces]|uniref:Helix-turn-helix domain-containing protein n=1 Tax=Streptomyces flaveolus TaxID=67297 RepID=A0ABV3A153_9ACTN|nr:MULTISPECIES: TetR/AcrR family transcriptional regulator [Streptomyces]KMS85201.1 TetR family transcriptional regulator [Streptomyces regensis]KOG75738.1 TetR family transcriptional regulator [Streptomyces antibioticus]KOX02019.1 TetR family transcriptional regulator [Streptomyces sp. NRRL WC-3723]MBG7703021.1 TetR family transcriptional regulator [Streptomyces sp. MC1]
MGRWQPNARERLAEAALELYGERGYEQTTVAEIAKRAGLTERTFFRHYADKREVLFGGSGELEELFVRAVAGTPVDTAPIQALAAGLDAVSEVFAGRRVFARARHAVITANAELKERELIKLASLSAALAGTLRGRGVPEPAASLAAEAGVAVFKIGYERWLEAAEDRDLVHLVREALTEFKAVAAAG